MRISTLEIIIIIIINIWHVHTTHLNVQMLAYSCCLHWDLSCFIQSLISIMNVHNTLFAWKKICLSWKTAHWKFGCISKGGQSWGNCIAKLLTLESFHNYIEFLTLKHILLLSGTEWGPGACAESINKKLKNAWNTSHNHNKTWVATIRGCTSGGVYVPCVHLYTRWDFL